MHDGRSTLKATDSQKPSHSAPSHGHTRFHFGEVQHVAIVYMVTVIQSH